MITATQSIIDMINSPVRKITAKVEVYDASTLVDTFSYDNKLESISIDRVSEEGKFFGFGICQRLIIKLTDMKREVNYITPNHTLKVLFGVNGEYICTAPTFYITQTRRDENTNELTIYGYDLIYDAAAHFTNELHITPPYSIHDLAVVCANVLGASGMDIQRLSEGETCFTRVYDTGANFEGTESLREALNDIAEATQTIYYVDADNRLIFKRLRKDAAADLALTKAKYITLDSGEGRRLGTICHTTELGDNISASIEASGSTQYVRDNDFWTAVDGTVTAELVNNALDAVGGLTINQFECTWRGNPLLEIGDKLAITTKSNSVVDSYVLDDKIEYNGSFKEVTRFNYKTDETETSTNSSNLGDALRQTFAKVDKAEKNVTLVASSLTQLQDKVADITVRTDDISATVEQVDRNANASIDAMQADMVSLSEKVNATMTAEAIDIKIQESITSGSKSIVTEKGFKFNDEGLTISSSDSEIKTTVTEDGMTVYAQSKPVLTANNVGVKATNLHAVTYLIVGRYSRFEDYSNRTGCFWIG